MKQKPYAYGFHWETVHDTSGEVVASGFSRDDSPPPGQSDVAEFSTRVTAVTAFMEMGDPRSGSAGAAVTSTPAGVVPRLLNDAKKACDDLHRHYQGNAMPDAVYAAFAFLRDDLIPSLAATETFRATPAFSQVALDVLAERVRQDAKWGGPAHDDQHGLEDFCGFINQRTTDLARGFETTEYARKTMIEIAALAVAAVESMDRKEQARIGRKMIASLRDALQQTNDAAAAAMPSSTTAKILFQDESAPLISAERLCRGIGIAPNDRSLPSVPASLIDAITTYGDARADGDMEAGAQRLAACITEIRQWMPNSINMTWDRPVSPGWYWYRLSGGSALQPALVFLREGALWYTLEMVDVDGPSDGLQMDDCHADARWSVTPISEPETA